MAVDKKKALKAGAKEGLIELAKLVPGVASLIEFVRKYGETIEEQQLDDFFKALCDRMATLEANANWFSQPGSADFVKKVVATALNAEYADKLEYLANALANGPTLGKDNPSRLKFVEMIRHLSKPSLDVLVASIKHPTGTGQILAGELAGHLGWTPELVDACVSELHAQGAFSNVKRWDKSGGQFAPREYFSGGASASTALTKSFAEFISSR